MEANAQRSTPNVQLSSQRGGILILLLLVLLLGGCEAKIGANLDCTNGKSHEWTAWSDTWPKANDFCYMQQTRHCKKCGLIQTEIHR